MVQWFEAVKLEGTELEYATGGVQAGPQVRWHANALILQSVSERMSHLGTCRWRSAVVEACDLRCRRPPQGLLRSCTGIFSSSGVGCGDAKRAREGPASRTALAADVSHSREPARALGSEYGVDGDAFTVCSSLHSAYCWAGTAPDVVSCVRQSPMNAGPAVAHPMPSTPAPLPAIPAAFVSHRPEKILP